MSRTQLKTAPHNKNAENLNLSGKRQAKDTNTNLIWMLGPSDKDCSATITTMLWQVIANTLETNVGIESISKETEDIKGTRWKS